jgi:hypothetical protein
MSNHGVPSVSRYSGKLAKIPACIGFSGVSPIRQAKATTKPIKLTDLNGLYVEVVSRTALIHRTKVT